MSLLSLTDWVDSASSDAREFQLRQAIHTTLHAISISSELRTVMLVKGGILLAIQYGSERYTRDIDFSTSQLHKEFNEESFIEELDYQLTNAVEELNYGLICLVQSKKLKPREGATYPTFEIGIGHAYSGTNQHRNLLLKKASAVLRIDYSFNEHQLHAPIEIKIDDTGVVQAYSLPDLLGEKYRALLQQEARNRIRSQDIYDIHLLLINQSLNIESDSELAIGVHRSLIEKSNSRDISVSMDSMRNPELRARAEKEYDLLGQTITGTLPNFDDAYDRVKGYFESLPWK